MPQDPPSKPRFGRIFTRSATSLTNLGVVGTAALAAVALASWPIAAIGGAAYAAMIAWDCASPDFWKKALGANAPAAVKFPDPAKLKYAPLGEAVTGILAARQEIAQVLSETPADVQANLSGAITQIAELERHAAMLITRGEDLAAYLGTVRRDAVISELAALDQKIRGASDTAARDQYQAARKTRAEQLAAIDDIGKALERTVATLSSIVAALQALPPKVVRMRALDAQAIDEMSGSVSDELERMNGEVRVFEETLRTLAEATNA